MIIQGSTPTPLMAADSPAWASASPLTPGPGAAVNISADTLVLTSYTVGVANASAVPGGAAYGTNGTFGYYNTTLVRGKLQAAAAAHSLPLAAVVAPAVIAGALLLAGIVAGTMLVKCCRRRAAWRAAEAKAAAAKLGQGDPELGDKQGAGESPALDQRSSGHGVPYIKAVITADRRDKGGSGGGDSDASSALSGSKYVAHGESQSA